VSLLSTTKARHIQNFSLNMYDSRFGLTCSDVGLDTSVVFVILPLCLLCEVPVVAYKLPNKYVIFGCMRVYFTSVAYLHYCS